MSLQMDLECVDLSDGKVVSQLYDQLINDYSVTNFFDFTRKFQFLSLPAHFTNQKLCLDEPVRPINTELLDEYARLHKEWKSNHKKCLRCESLNTCQVFDVVDTVQLQMETHVQTLPTFIGQQFLFENEPCNVPQSVETFYEMYCSDGVNPRHDVTSDVIRYHQQLLEMYPRALHDWKLTLSKGKLVRYELYCALRSIKTVVKTATKATKAKPISM